jgi:hypothetical protein
MHDSLIFIMTATSHYVWEISHIYSEGRLTSGRHNANNSDTVTDLSSRSWGCIRIWWYVSHCVLCFYTSLLDLNFLIWLQHNSSVQELRSRSPWEFYTRKRKPNKSMSEVPESTCSRAHSKCKMIPMIFPPILTISSVLAIISSRGLCVIGLPDHQQHHIYAQYYSCVYPIHPPNIV